MKKKRKFIKRINIWFQDLFTFNFQFLKVIRRVTKETRKKVEQLLTVETRTH